MKLKEEWAVNYIKKSYSGYAGLISEFVPELEAFIKGFEFARDYIIEHGGNELTTSKQLSELGESETGN